MTEFAVRNYNGHLYIKGEIKNILDTNPIRALANAKSVVLFPNDIDLADVEESLEIVLKDIRLRRRCESENPTATSK